MSAPEFPAGLAEALASADPNKQQQIAQAMQLHHFQQMNAQVVSLCNVTGPLAVAMIRQGMKPDAALKKAIEIGRKLVDDTWEYVAKKNAAAAARIAKEEMKDRD